MITERQRLILFRFLLAAALAVAVTMALVPRPPALMGEIGDKWHHMAAFATLALLAANAYPRERLWRVAEHLSFLGALIEVLQALPAIGRSCDVWDWLADTGAAAATLLLVALVRRARAAT